MENFNFKTKKEVLDFLKENKIIRFVRIIFPDILGREMSFCIPSEQMKSAFENGKGFDGSSVAGFARIEESDLNIVPDPKTFLVLPWSYEVSRAFMERGSCLWRFKIFIEKGFRKNKKIWSTFYRRGIGIFPF